MKNKLPVILLVLFAFAATAQQISYFNQGFLQQQNAAQDRAWLGIGGTNTVGSGTVSNFTATGFSPLFSSSVTTPTTFPHLAFTAIPQGPNLVYAGPDMITGLPTFRRLTTNDLPQISSGGTGTVTSVGLTGPSEFSYGPPVTTSGNLSFSRTADADFLGFGAFNIGFLRVTNLGTFRGLWVTNGITNAGPMLVQGGVNITGTAGLNVTYSGTFGGLTYNVANYGDQLSDGGWFAAYLNAPSLLTDSLGGKSGDEINMVGDLWLKNSSGAGTIKDNSGNTLIDSAGNFFGNGAGMSGVVLSITNASLNVDPTRITMVGTSNTPIPSIKSISAGSGVTLTDQKTNVVISASGGGGSSTNSVDLYMTNLTSYANSSNYFIDFAFPSATLTTATNVINFNYGTNFGLNSTSRVCNIYIPATNFGRIVTFTGLATNWHVQPQIYFVPLGYNCRLLATAFGTSDSGIVISPFLDTVMATTNTTAIFNPTNALPSVGLLGTKLWLDASVKAWQDETLTVPCVEGTPVRGWTDLSGVVGVVTNNATTAQNLFYHTTQMGPFNVPCMRVYPNQTGAATWLQAPAMSALSQPIYIFLMVYGRSGGVIVDSTAGGRVAINPAQMGQVGSAFNTAGIQYTSARAVSWTLVTYVANGASSSIRTNGTTAVSGNAGTTSPSQFIVFGDNSKSVQVGEYNVAEILVCATNMSNTQLTNVESYFYRKYPFFNPPTVQ